jgi:hypothetical protein
MGEYLKKILSYGASPALAVALYSLTYFTLTPIAIWQFPVGLVAALVALAGIVLATFLPKGRPNARTKVIALAVPGLAFLVFLFWYNGVSDKPPYVGWVWYWHAVCIVTYFGTFLALGYFSAFMGRLLMDKGWISEPKEKKGEKEHDN